MLFLTALILAATVYLMIRRVEVRLVLLGAGLLMALLAGKPLLITDTFARAMVAGMVAPICAAMGFAMVIQHTGCDKHLVHLLLAPVRRVRFLMLPGGILIAYLVNMAVSSQTSTAAALGPILVPLLLAGGYSPTVAGGALILGASFGGDLLNPGAQDVQAIAGVANLSAPEMSARIIPASIAGAVTAALVFTIIHGRPAKDAGNATETAESGTHTVPPEAALETDSLETPSDAEPFRIHPVRAVLPLVPVALLLLGYGGFPYLHWLVRVPEAPEWKPLANALPVVRAMLIGCVLTALIRWRDLPHITKSLFDGMGQAYASIISLTITAQCFGAGIAAVGLSDALLNAATRSGSLPLLATGFPWALSVLSGSGSGPILAFAQTFLAQMNGNPNGVHLAALACLGGAFGRTMSPVAAVVVYSSGLVNVTPVLLIRTLLPALLAGAIVALLVASR
jgi:DcuC family C4-dicarboxylate transporter